MGVFFTQRLFSGCILLITVTIQVPVLIPHPSLSLSHTQTRAATSQRRHLSRAARTSEGRQSVPKPPKFIGSQRDSILNHNVPFEESVLFNASFSTPEGWWLHFGPFDGNLQYYCLNYNLMETKKVECVKCTASDPVGLSLFLMWPLTR